jgi:pyruvate kinase-like protein
MARRAKIVCTIGPATSGPDQIAALVAAGLDVARLNMSHGSQDSHLAAYREIRAAGDASGPHKSLPGRATPAAAYAARPKAVPGDRSADTHDRVRTDRVGANGAVTLRHGSRLYHLGIGRAHAEPTSCCSSRTSTSASSPPPPASCSANSPSIPAATTSPPANHADRNRKHRDPMWIHVSSMS